ncbi:ribonuclease R [Sulfuriflexus sp.]|uniref:ribonuclease R n=1 Tax=Sulfuriflexus sp. TaxID=2015443 RepID=UPI0028CBD03F|nr:ribonuclease R [Sulfuriflexus sp.]MDT8405246.1 ribonuclease R [Sulfuriflexus sp.]
MNTKKPVNDPFAGREAEKYAQPIPSREYILEILGETEVPLDFKLLADKLELYEDDDRIALQRRLNAMERDGQLLRNRRGSYCLPERLDLVRGRVSAHVDGFGFLIPEEGGDDVFLHARQMRGVLHGDRVMVRVTGLDRRGRREGAVVEVLERRNESVVGRYYEESGIGFVAPDNPRLQDLIIPPEHRGVVKEGQIVVAIIIEQPTRRSQPIGRISEVLGDHMAPGMEIDIALRSYNLPHEWPDAVMDEAALYGDSIPTTDMAGREDLRNVPLVTIDGEDARDFDDAVFCEPHADGWRLLVAIADVSSYVAVDSALDKEAVERGNSVYFPEQVIPMLPVVLSNGLCSLNPDVDRLCMVCELFFDGKGKITNYNFMRGVMRSHARLTYNQVGAMLVDGDVALRKVYTEVVPHLESLHALYKVLRKSREKRGAIDFETTETRIVFGEGRKIERITPVVRNDAHKLIEECMISANIAAASFLSRHNMPTLYRVHEGPEEDRLNDLHEFLRELGLTMEGGSEPEPKHYAKVLSQVGDRPDAHMIQMIMLRSLRQAVYTPEEAGHFGLALQHYAHFTSPIRRYPDLLVHRGIRHILAGGTADNFVYTETSMQRFGEQCSMSERRADEATRDVVSWLKCEYMMDKVGEDFNGTITAVTGFGVFIELDDIYVEGLVHVTALANDFYHFDPVSHCLIGENQGVCFRIGDRLRIKVARVDLDTRKMDFEMLEVISSSEDYARHKLTSVRRGKKSGGKKSRGKKTSHRRSEGGGADKKSAKKRSRSKKPRSSR